MEFFEFANIKTPSFLSEKLYNGKPYLEYGENNLYPQELLQISDKSVTHLACIEFKNLAIAGQGYTNVSKKADKFIKTLNYRTEFTTLQNKLALSLAIFDGFALQVIWNNASTAITSVHYTPFENVRVGKTDEWGNPVEFYVNNNWENKPQDYICVKTFDMDKKAIKEAGGRQLLYSINKSGKSLFYPNPRYSAAINYIFAEYEMSVHQLSSITNGYSVSKMITFVGKATPEQKLQNKRNFDKAFRGSENAGKIIVDYVDDISNKPVVEDLTPSTIVDQYIQADQMAQTKILTAHGITSPSLIGLNDGNSSIFSNGEELATAYDVFYNTKIKPYHLIIEQSMNLILEGAGFKNEDYKVLPYSPVTIPVTTTDSTEIVDTPEQIATDTTNTNTQDPTAQADTNS